MTPTASILVSSFNHQQFLNNCLNSIKSSVCNQIEIIILDDASSDHSKKTIEQWFKNNYKRFFRVQRIFHKKNIGVSESFVELISASKAEILLPLASDDMYLPETVDERIKFLKNNPDIWVGFSDAQAINSKGNIIVPSLNNFFNNKFINCSYQKIKKELILNWNYPANIQFWRKGDWIKEITPGMFSEDIEIALFSLLKKKIKYLNKTLYQYRTTDWPIKTKGCEKTKRLHLCYYYRKAAKHALGVSRLAFLALSQYNLDLAVGDEQKAKESQKRLSLLKKVPSLFYK